MGANEKGSDSNYLESENRDGICWHPQDWSNQDSFKLFILSEVFEPSNIRNAHLWVFGDIWLNRTAGAGLMIEMSLTSGATVPINSE